MKSYNKEEKKKSAIKEFLFSPIGEGILVFVIGGLIYFLTEMLWRGYSHMAMFAAGGICFAVIYFMEKAKCMKPYTVVVRCFFYALLITAVEFVFGVFCNILLKLAIWDYSSLPYNLLGQVCPSFFLAWCGISLVAVGLSALLRSGFAALKRQFA